MKRVILSAESDRRLSEYSKKYIRQIIRDAKNNVLDLLGYKPFNDEGYDLGREIVNEIND